MSTLCITVASSRSVLLLNLLLHTHMYVCMCTVLACTVCTLHNLLSRVCSYVCIHTLSYLTSVLVHAPEHLKLHIYIQ